MPAEPTTENLLTVASYGITGRITQLIEVLRLLDELHGPRKLDADDLAGSDVRCKTCRNSSGKPCPWPCVTWLRFAEVLDLGGCGPATVAFFRALGRVRNGGPVPDVAALAAAMTAERDDDEPAGAGVPELEGAA